MPASKIIYQEGNLFEEIYDDTTAYPIVVVPHIVNNTGAWGGGFTRYLSEWSGEPEYAYAAVIDANKGKDPGALLGKCHLVPCEPAVIVANLFAQDNSKFFLKRSEGKAIPMSKVVDFPLEPLVDYGAFARSLDALGTALDLPSPLYTIHMPPVGVGIGGGEWVKIKEILEAFCAKFATDVHVDCIDHDLFERISNA